MPICVVRNTRKPGHYASVMNMQCLGGGGGDGGEGERDECVLPAEKG